MTIVFVLLGGVSQDAGLFELITFSLEKIQIFSVVLGSPYLVRRGPILILECKRGIVGVIRVLEAMGHVIIEGSCVFPVEGVKSFQLFGRENLGVNLDL